MSQRIRTRLKRGRDTLFRVQHVPDVMYNEMVLSWKRRPAAGGFVPPVRSPRQPLWSTIKRLLGKLL